MDEREPLGDSSDQDTDRLRQIEEELEKAGSTRFADPEESGLAAQLDEIERRAKAAKAVHAKHTPEGNPSPLFAADSGRSLGLGMQIAFAILGVPLAGFGVGFLVDMFVGGVFWRGILTILGATVAVWYAVKASARS